MRDAIWEKTWWIFRRVEITDVSTSSFFSPDRGSIRRRISIERRTERWAKRIWRRLFPLFIMHFLRQEFSPESKRIINMMKKRKSLDDMKGYDRHMFCCVRFSLHGMHTSLTCRIIRILGIIYWLIEMTISYTWLEIRQGLNDDYWFSPFVSVSFHVFLCQTLIGILMVIRYVNERWVMMWLGIRRGLVSCLPFLIQFVDMSMCI